MKTVYLDNASTSFPKAPSVADAMYDYLKNSCVNVNRGGYQSAFSVEEKIYETREQLCRLFHFPKAKNVIFTPNVTTSLNILLKGLLHKGDHVLVSSMEHNAVMRPLVQLSKEGVSFSRIPGNPDGSMKTETLSSFITPHTKALVCLHASNVCGTIMPVKFLSSFCREHNLFFILDAAQTAGVLPIHMDELFIDGLAFTGHKGLRGPQGTGGFLLSERLEKELIPLLSGGTGSISHTEEIPSFLPDRFEPGTPNIPGILGLHAALSDLEQVPFAHTFCKESELTEYFLKGLSLLDKNEDYIRVIGRKNIEERCAVVSVQTLQKDMAEAAYELDTAFGIQTRVGLHCAPSAHKTLETYPSGTIRFSFGPENTKKELDLALHALSVVSGITKGGISHGI
ncbi:putative cysteine desulfurase [uncultured Blautia sp.]